VVPKGGFGSPLESGWQMDHSAAFLVDFLIRLIRLLYRFCALRAGAPGAVPVDERYLKPGRRRLREIML
jgi:hypothetical protein